MYGHVTAVSKANKIKLPMRQAMERACVTSHRSALIARVRKALRKNHGIIFKKQWWNLHRVGPQVTTRAWREWLKQMRTEAQHA